MREMPIRDFETERRFVLDLGTHPHAEFQNGLEFIVRVVPPVVVAECVRRQLVVGRAPPALCEKGMICLPFSVNGAAADVAMSHSLSEHFFALGGRERLSRRNRSTKLCLPTPTCQQQLMEEVSKCLGCRGDDLS